MRKESKVALSIVGFSAIASSYLLGQHANPAGAFVAAPAEQQSQGPSAAPSSSAAQATSPAQTKAAKPTQSASASPSPSATKSATAKPSPTKTATSTPTPSAATYNSGVVNYQYGTIELQVTVSGGHLDSINLLQATTHGRQYANVPSILADAAVKAGGSNFGNLSGATYTTNAFKKALDAALSNAGL